MTCPVVGTKEITESRNCTSILLACNQNKTFEICRMRIGARTPNPRSKTECSLRITRWTAAAASVIVRYSVLTPVIENVHCAHTRGPQSTFQKNIPSLRHGRDALLKSISHIAPFFHTVAIQSSPVLTCIISAPYLHALTLLTSLFTTLSSPNLFFASLATAKTCSTSTNPLSQKSSHHTNHHTIPTTTTAPTT